MFRLYSVYIRYHGLSFTNKKPLGSNLTMAEIKHRSTFLVRKFVMFCSLYYYYYYYY